MLRSTGLSLLEVLVALLITGVGVLAVTGLQTVALQSNRMALERAEAAYLADAMVERIRAGSGGQPSGVSGYRLEFGDAPPAAVDCLAQNCSMPQLVAFDQAQWKCQLGAFHDRPSCRRLRYAGILPDAASQPGLPRGDGAVAVEPDGAVRVSVRWFGVDGQTSVVTLTGRP